MKALMNLLFVCSKNQWRSPTAERIYQDHPNLNVRSAGISQSARKLINSIDINWSDIIFVMENKHKSYITDHFRDQLNNKRLIVLDIPDEYQYMDDELIKWLTESVNAYLLQHMR